MRVTVDGRNLMLAQPTGVGSYAAGMVASLRSLGHPVEIVCQGAGQGRAQVWLRAIRPGRTPCPPADAKGLRLAPAVFRAAQVHFDLFGSPLALTGAPPDLAVWTYPLPVTWPGVPNITVVHDLIPLLHGAMTGIDGARMRRILAGALGRASHVLTVSEATRQEVLATFGCDPARVTATGQALNLPPPAATAPAPNGDYFLYVGSVEPRKNIRRLLRAYRASGVATPLVIAGPDGWQAGAELAGLLPASGVVRLDFLDRPTLVRLMMGAKAMLFPSLAEGFGLPVAEAMALATPVLTSHTGALLETAGGAALLVDPLSVDAIAQGIRALDDDAPLRARLVQAGLVRAREFTVDAQAARLAGTLASLARPT